MTAAEVRAAMGQELCAIADALREKFGAKLTYLKTAEVALGTKQEEGIPTQWHGERKRA